MTGVDRPWEAEHEVSGDLAAALIAAHFPALAPARIEPFGVGWDNAAFLVNGLWVFRFPRRAIAVPLLETEGALLPSIAPRLPLPVPVPEMLARGDERFPWPFSGYRMLPGETACRADLSERQRMEAAAPIAEFLAALHAVPAADARRAGAGQDTLRRLDVARRAPQIAERLERCASLGLLPNVEPWMTMSADTPSDWTPGATTLVHGDLYARHLLVDPRGRPAGVIDWGDVHLGDPAVDLSIAHGFLPPEAHEEFRRRYGPIADAAWRMARFKALHAAVVILLYGHDVGDEALVREGGAALEFLARR